MPGDFVTKLEAADTTSSIGDFKGTTTPARGTDPGSCKELLLYGSRWEECVWDPGASMAASLEEG